jgi:hypothetical protein
MKREYWMMKATNTRHPYSEVTRENLPLLYTIASASLAEATAQFEQSQTQMTRFRDQVKAAGLGRELDNVENPPKPPKEEARVRVKVLKGIRFPWTRHATVNENGYTRYEERTEMHEAGGASVIDIPESTAKAFVKAGRVVVVPASTEFKHCPIAGPFELADLA